MDIIVSIFCNNEAIQNGAIEKQKNGIKKIRNNLKFTYHSKIHMSKITYKGNLYGNSIMFLIKFPGKYMSITKVFPDIRFSYFPTKTGIIISDYVQENAIRNDSVNI